MKDLHEAHLRNDYIDYRDFSYYEAQRLVKAIEDNDEKRIKAYSKTMAKYTKGMNKYFDYKEE